MPIVGRARIPLPALLCQAGLCTAGKSDWVSVVAQPEGTRTVLKIDWEPPAGRSKHATVKGQMASADATFIEPMVSPGVSRTFK